MNLVLFIAAAVIAVAWGFGVIATGTWREAHHYHYGTPFVLLAIFGVVPEWVGWIALAVQTDDAVQHVVQVIDPEFRSPLHLLFRKLIYQPWTRRHAKND